MTRSTRPNIKTLTSLRFFAAAAIVFGHMRGHFGIPREWAQDFPHYLGVTFFFVLSGFILTLSYPKLEGAPERRNFIIARFARIWPLHMFTLALYCISGLFFIDKFSDYMVSESGLLAAAANIFLLHAWIPMLAYALSYNGVSWSISVEAFFYCAFIWLIFLDRTRWRTLLLIGIAPAIVLIVISQFLFLPRYATTYHVVSMDMLLYINPAARLFEFTLGMSASHVFQRYDWTKVGIKIGTVIELFAVGLIVFAMTVMTYSTFAAGPISKLLPGAVTLWLERCGAAPLFCGAIFIFAMERGMISRILQHRILVLGGEISYSIYLFHLIAQKFVSNQIAAPAEVKIVIYIGLVIFGSYLCWRFVEMPARIGIMRTVQVARDRR